VISIIATSRLYCFLAICGGLSLLAVAAVPAFAADHPELPKGSECLSCHVEKTKGQSFHFDFTNACTVCHVVRVEDGKTSISLVLPKEKICYSCHEKAAMDKMEFMKGECVSCHDPHNSERLHLLRANVPVPSEKPRR
jgi:predicted CXXCH cytochrome family protein